MTMMMRKVRTDEAPFKADLCGRNLAPGKCWLQQCDPWQSGFVVGARIVSENTKTGIMAMGETASQSHGHSKSGKGPSSVNAG